MVRILIVEDQKIMQKYFEYIIMQEPEFRHVQTVSDAREAVKICGYSAIDLVIMDVQTFHNHDGLSAGKEIREKYPDKTIWLYTGSLWEEIQEYEILRYLDVCVDGEFQVDKKEVLLKWKGSANQRVIDVQASLREGKAVLQVE